jgi:hypothetical protein
VKEIVCNYAVARFRPYREIGEFVNLGVLLVCPQVDFFGFLFETRKHKRITDFFPELDLELLKAATSAFTKELSRIAGPSNSRYEGQLVLKEQAPAILAHFRELVRPREGLFQFSEIGTTLAQDPRAKLTELFQFYVKRQFAHDREYQETIMRRHLAEFMHKNQLDRFYKTDQQIGDEHYHVIIPFVYFEGSEARKAIKPLHLDKDSPTEIYRHGDSWISTVRRLRAIKRLPAQFLFATKSPKPHPKKIQAAEDICNELLALDVSIIPFSETERILEFARVA